MDNPYIERALVAMAEGPLKPEEYIFSLRAAHIYSNLAIAWELQQVREAGLLPAIDLWGHSMAGSGASSFREGLLDE